MYPLKRIEWTFLSAAFVVPFCQIVSSGSVRSNGLPFVLLCAASVIQHAGLVAGRWFFFAEARHPQTLYYRQA